ncbi:hypothetical protein [Kineococcus xinjiangensis]|uniref:hypothetical protein n=1 Tax=Kineococcus xinjiangensis TaxID=512762 RepID=UPI0011B0D724|nr:hypothetical protein [Kineococcus xinjiangensis]
MSSPVLGFDLVRLPCGDAVAGVLLHALACSPRDLEVLAARHDGPARERAWDRVREITETVPRMDEVLSQVANGLVEGDFDDAVTGPRVESGVVRVLQASTVADADALVRLVHHDILDWTWTQHDGGVGLRTEVASHAGEVLADAAVSAYLGQWLPADLRRTLVAPYLTAVKDLPPLSRRPSALGHAQAGAVELLERLAAMDAEDRACLRAAAQAVRASGGEWASAVHDASWAVHLSDRVRTAAEAQMLAVRAFRAGGLDAGDGASGVWNVVSGALHAEVVADLLGGESRERLMRPWEAAFPPVPPAPPQLG